MICKEPTIYKQGLQKDDLTDILSNWEDVSDKVFNTDGVDSTDRNVKFFFNRYLGLCKITGWAKFSSDGTANRKIISFNTDLPGNQNENLFSFTSAGKIRSSNLNKGIGTVIFRPFAHSTVPMYNNGIYLDAPSISCDYVDCIYVVTNIDKYLHEFIQYIDQ